VSGAALEEQLALPGLQANSLGALSIGHPHEGYLMNAVRMPEGKYWTVALPTYAYGTEETIAGLIRCITLVNQRIQNSPKVIIGSISKEDGGRFPPHKSHQSGRDADVGFYYNPGFPSAKPATRENLDVERTWALVRTFIVETDVDMILIDSKVQRLLEVHALRRGEDPVWLKSVFHGTGRPYTALIMHAPGHDAHMHVRFSSPIARQRGKSSYATLVEQGHIKLRRTELKHRIKRGDTLLGIAAKYHTSVDTVRRLNHLESTKIRVGQALLIQEPEHLRGAFDPIVVPKRRVPDSDPRSTRAGSLTASSPVAPAPGEQE
jgi:LysM repeat protein